MKTSSDMKTCPDCKSRYSAAESSDECPHKSRNESEYFRKLRAQGPPYKLESWKQTEAEQ